MGGAYGLQTHIWNNNWKTVLLMAGFPVLLLLLTYALFLLFAGFAGYSADGSAVGPFVWAGQALAGAWPFAIAGALLWFGIAYVFYQNMIDAATGAHKVERTQEPKLYNLLENLCISRGVTMPALRVMETESLNAFATGLHKGQYSITVTRGLMHALNDKELEAVLAHELTHIRNADVRLLVIAVIFVGIFSFVGEIAFRSLRFSGGSSSRRGSSRDGGGAAAAIIVALIIIGIAYGLAIVIRFAMSRRREYLADAGAVELTKDPDAMISALQKISGNAVVSSAPSEVREMFIENPHSDFASIFATHPPIEKRIEALMKFAGGRIAQPATAPAPAQNRRRGPWG